MAADLGIGETLVSWNTQAATAQLLAAVGVQETRPSVA